MLTCSLTMVWIPSKKEADQTTVKQIKGTLQCPGQHETQHSVKGTYSTLQCWKQLGYFFLSPPAHLTKLWLNQPTTVFVMLYSLAKWLVSFYQLLLLSTYSSFSQIQPHVIFVSSGLWCFNTKCVFRKGVLIQIIAYPEFIRPTVFLSQLCFSSGNTQSK